MCGIILFIDKNNKLRAINESLNALYQLQNRGYDSFGLCYLNKNNEYIINKKSINCERTTADLFEDFKNNQHDYHSNICMGHSRWATHGPPNYNNSHPHISYNKSFICVHNGIIENSNEIKTLLIENGYMFYSDTDTEILVNLLEYYYYQSKDIKKAFNSLINSINGTYGLIILNNINKEDVYIIKNGSPIIISESENEFMVSSELSGFNNLTKSYYDINNNELITISKKDNYSFKKNHSIRRTISTDFFNNYLTQDLGNYEHYTQKEIIEQDRTLLLSLNNGARISNNSIKLGGLNFLTPYINNIKNIVFLGCGSSYIAGQIGCYYIKSIKNIKDINVFAYDGGDFSEIDIPNNGTCLFVFISQSGETMDLIKNFELIKEKNHISMGIINVIDSTIAKMVDCGIYMNVGKEVAVASTKSFNSSVLLLKLLSLWILQNKNIEHKELIIQKQIKFINNLNNDIKKVNNEINIYLDNLNLIKFINQNIFILGKGSLEYIAKETALKLKEICYIHGEGLSSSSLKHGPLALIHHSFPVILLINHENFDKMINTLNELIARKAYILIISSVQNILVYIEKTKKYYDLILLPDNKYCNEILFMITLQHICYYMACYKKINPDKPKNLAKVVTVE